MVILDDFICTLFKLFNPTNNMKILSTTLFLICLLSCTIHENYPEAAASLESRSVSFQPFSKIGSIDLGNTGASEISAFDPVTKRLFVVNNSDGNNFIEVLDIKNMNLPVKASTILLSNIGGAVNSLDVYGSTLAAAIESRDKVSPGIVALFNTSDLRLLKTLTVGSLPDMITFSPNGKYILTANEGEPSADYSKDPLGTISIIDIMNDYQVTTLDFTKFGGANIFELMTKGLRYFGPKASFAQDIEPEYITISDNSKWAWVSLQENNAIARVNIQSKEITDVFPLGFKALHKELNSIDASDRDNAINFTTYPVRGIYEPDGLAVLRHNGYNLVYSANEGDAREYTSYEENTRLGSSGYLLDPSTYPLGNLLKDNTKLGRLNVTKALGDFDKDGDFDQIYTHGARSFSIWSGETGDMVYDSHNEIDKLMAAAGKYSDSRSDDKGSEPETILIGNTGYGNILIIALERSDAVLLYDLSNPISPKHLQTLNTGTAPEGLIFIPAIHSPNGKNTIVVSCEGDGQVILFSE